MVEKSNKNNDFYDVVLGSRISLVRNLQNYKFPNVMDSEEANIIKDILKEKIYNIDNFNFIYKDTIDLDDIEAEKLVESYKITRQLLVNKKKSGYFINDNQDITIMINEQNHLKIQVLNDGYKLKEIYDIALKIDNKLEENISYAFNYKYGYLTTTIKEIGTGLKVNVLVHLPALTLIGDVGEYIDEYKRLGINIEPFYLEFENCIEDIYCISNARTIGISEENLLEKLEKAVYKIAAKEREIRSIIYEIKAELIEDRVFRALGILKNARIMKNEEAVDYLADVRLGVSLGMYDKLSLEEITNFMISIQNNNIIYNYLDNDEDIKHKDIIRAEIIRNRLDNLEIEKEE